MLRARIPSHFKVQGRLQSFKYMSTLAEAHRLYLTFYITAAVCLGLLVLSAIIIKTKFVQLAGNSPDRFMFGESRGKQLHQGFKVTFCICCICLGGLISTPCFYREKVLTGWNELRTYTLIPLLHSTESLAN